MLNSNVSKVNTYVGTDGKLHFVNSAGADTALNFSSGGATIVKVYSGSKYSGTVNIKSSYPNIYSSLTKNNFLFRPLKSYLSMYICYFHALTENTTYTFNATASYSYNATTGVFTYNLGKPGGTETNAYTVSAYCNSLEIYLVY